MWVLNQKQWKKIDKLFSKLLPIILALLLVYIVISVVDTQIPKLYENIIKYVIIGFFSGELIVKYQFYDTKKEFMKEEWLNILLVIPFLKIVKLFKVAGLLGKVVKSAKLLPYIQKGVKIPKVLKKLRKK